MDPALAEYYRPLKSIVGDPLFSWERIANFFAFNMGKYDHFLREYVERQR
jgi:hypothetical protein